MSIRSIALDDVIRILEEKKPLHKVLSDSLLKIADQRDRAFLSRLVRGCVERALSIDIMIDMMSSVKIKKQKTVVRNILRCGIYQILFMGSVTDFAACDESVKLAGKRGFKHLSGFVNGVLRSVCRRREELLEDMNRCGRDNFPFRYSMPEWIVDSFCTDYGEAAAEKAFRYFLEESRVSIRVNSSKGGLDKLSEEIEKKSGTFEKNKYLDDCFFLSGIGSIEELKSFKDGIFVVQDMSSALVGYCAGKCNIAGRQVLDLCAAPGGKSIHLADLGAEVTSCDISDQKLSLIKESVSRCGFDNLSVILNDATLFNERFEGRFDMVICDLPCSGLGIIGKKPDIKYNASPEKIKELSVLQRQILKNVVRYLKPDGYLIYSTCTVSPFENYDTVQYIKNELGLSPVNIADYLPDGMKMRSGLNEECCIQLLPGEYGSDGFFISIFRRMP